MTTPPKKLSNVRFLQATYHEYNAVTSSKRVDQLVNIIVREEDTRLINAISKLTSDRPFVITGFFTIGEDKMVLLELLDIDILYHMTVLSPKHSPQSPLKSNTTSRFQNIVQEIKNQLPPPSPTSPINHQTTVTSINPSTLTPPTLTPPARTPPTNFYPYLITFHIHLFLSRSYE